MFENYKKIKRFRRMTSKRLFKNPVRNQADSNR